MKRTQPKNFLIHGWDKSSPNKCGDALNKKEKCDKI